ncbi:MAG TPA: DegT/DnrJ/EryC1/StrS family aminotransferase [Acidimicrobiales bacterium]|jgi:dTDP-4-amino-4,6-dideoxygalactose transaminase|nr:DegT/DnrJ/EryC1/StrS family aminotransferase [Acidimicrobiales bacterium]
MTAPSASPREPKPLRVPPAQVHIPAVDREAILRRIDAALESGQLTLGAIGRELEERFAAHHGAKHAIAVNSGTSAIEIPLRAIGVQGREVLVPANTFFATAAAVIAAGARPKFVDCDPATMAVDVDSVRAAIGPDTAGLVLVHIGGLVTPAIHQLKALCDEHGLFLFEDAAHAHGSSLDDRMAGTFGVASSFSFYPTKVMTAAEGGIILTDDDHLADEARAYRDQGKASFTANVHTHLGYNWRMSEPHAAIALSQLARLDEFIGHRQLIAKIYDGGLGSLPLTPLAIPAAAGCNYYKYVAYLPDGIDRAALKQTLRNDHGVGLSGEVYELPLHAQPVFEPWVDGPLPGAERICASHICLPISAKLTEEQAEIVITSLRSALGTQSHS